MANLYPDDFFNIPNPVSPWVSIQIRTSFNVGNGGVITDETWDEITLDPSNFFDNLIIEDSGGIYHVTLNLFDKNFANLENLLMESITASRLSNEVSKNQKHSVDDTEFFDFMISNSRNANLRIRFGYSIWDNIDEYIDPTDFVDEEYRDRKNKKKPVIRSPWIYLQIMGMKNTFTENGFKTSLNCYSTTGAFLDRAKMVQKHAKIIGNPKDVILQIGEKIKNLSNGEIEVVIEEDPLERINQEGNSYIEVMLGSEPIKREINGHSVTIPQYRSIKRLFDMICNKIETKKYRSDESVIVEKIENKENVETSPDEVFSFAKYGYSVIQEEINGRIKNIVSFKYLDPINAKQENTRVYSWLNSGSSIVKTLDIQSSIDFAQLNAPISLISPNGQNKLYSATGEPVDEENPISVSSYKLGVIRNITEGMKKGTFNAQFVTEIFSTVDEGDSLSITNTDDMMYAERLVKNLNNGMFKGNIVIPGDPFYLFDGTISPYIYKIKVIVRRPDYYNEDGVNVDGGISYLSGDYVISKITHNIGASGYTTTLEIAKFPSTK